ncbi:p53 apoptosis effector related to PMP-22-like [Lytechinus variegatus]|uniref:p53 apoptosis effector related to PMP-22-like n=1 Tax=Lytechinus variegatus TaxID=7654 RepID=UPI001BB2A20D|nr:p53 apoptosis effector related to PMP-22-like [Lytechinus variegatus]XP_041479385.1 p53 apoptosis effector related to PMP-22-like [Lytechinus variegatus]XP_041479386.1 p53 apoptosis effector related to PMP-22-like [Lytechinus variegatus]XP_041479387.1 p53 apoptosis effector related to PMP-22-like [Lytechinus variegatus]
MMETETTVTTRVFRPFKITALVLCVIAAVGSVASIANKAWVVSASYEQGLWQECYNGSRTITPGQTLPTNQPMMCYSAMPSAWLTSARAFALVALVILVIAILTAIISFIKGQQFSRLFVVAGVLVLLAAMCQLIPLIIFPTKFIAEDVIFGRTNFDLHWGWGLGLGVFFIEVAAGIVFIVAPDTQEIHYSEKTVYTNGGTME